MARRARVVIPGYRDYITHGGNLLHEVRSVASTGPNRVYVVMSILVTALLSLTSSVWELKWLESVLEPYNPNEDIGTGILCEFAVVAVLRSWAAALTLKLFLNCNPHVPLSVSKILSCIMVGIYLIAGIGSGAYVILSYDIAVSAGCIYVSTIGLGMLTAAILLLYDSRKLVFPRLAAVTVSLLLHLLSFGTIAYNLFLPREWTSLYLAVSLVWILASLVLLIFQVKPVPKSADLIDVNSES